MYNISCFCLKVLENAVLIYYLQDKSQDLCPKGDSLSPVDKLFLPVRLGFKGAFNKILVVYYIQ